MDESRSLSALLQIFSLLCLQQTLLTGNHQREPLPVSDRPGLSVPASLPVYMSQLLSTAQKTSVVVTSDREQVPSVHPGCSSQGVQCSCSAALLVVDVCLAVMFIMSGPGWATPRQFSTGERGGQSEGRPPTDPDDLRALQI
ncbi:hypothetical protein QBC45DRAFT_431544 [Copromyces sp. CBS 386.78]|nr:hypothetical protein QBC45DRAFT_431544 [Copromyces sp. CBS 386.78]